MDMNSDIWSRLSEDLLLLVLSHLPSLITVRFRTVCRRWRYLLRPSQPLQQISSKVPTCSSPAFIMDLCVPGLIHSVFNSLYLIQPLTTSRMYRIPFMGADCGKVLTACKSLLCCSDEEAPTSFNVCNPVTRTWKPLPPPIQLSKWDFIGLAFDTSTVTCKLVIGTRHNIEEENMMEMEIYSSETDAWTKLQMIDTPISIDPRGEGVYSRGRFYWINTSSVNTFWVAGMMSTTFRFDIAVFNVANCQWDVISLPERPDGAVFENCCHWKLTGYDGKVILVNRKILCLWELMDDDEKNEWSEWHAFPFRGLEIYGWQQGVNVLVNTCGQVCVHLPKKKLVVFDGDCRMMYKMEGQRLVIFERGSSSIPLHAYEINNIWWPS